MSSGMVAVMAALANRVALVGVLRIMLAAPSSVALPYQHPARHHSKQIVPRELAPPSVWMPRFRFTFPTPRQELIEVDDPHHNSVHLPQRNSVDRPDGRWQGERLLCGLWMPSLPYHLLSVERECVGFV
jgi:hypothetical protein